MTYGDRPGGLVDDQQARWSAGGGWWVRRILRAVVPLLAFCFIALHITGHGDVLGSPSRALMSHSFHHVPVFFVAFVALIVLILASSVLVGRHRRGAAHAAATARGWSYVRRAPEFTRRWRTSPFGRGHSRRATDVITGAAGGRAAAAFGYRYTTGSGDNQTTTSLSVCTVSLGTALPPLSVVPESLVRLFAPGLGRLDIDIEDETFNRFNRVNADSPQYAVAVLNPRAVEALLRLAPFAWQIDGSDLVGWSEVVPIQTMLDRVDALAAVAEQVPPFVYDTYGSAGPVTPTA